MRSQHGLLAGAAIGLGGLVATILLHGWWQPAAAAVSILGGSLLLFSFLALGIAADRSRPDRSDWAQGRRRMPPERRRRQAARSARTSKSTTTATVADVKTAAAASPNA
jgi:hypothetical protein